MLFLRGLRRFFAGSPSRVHPFAFRRQTTAYRQSLVLVRVYYVALSYLAIALLPSVSGLLHPASIAPLWAVGWLRQVPLSSGVAAILWVYIGGAVAAALFPDWRWARLLAFIGVFQFVAYNNSFGKIGHSMHAWVLTSLVLVFLPRHGESGSSGRARRQSYLQIFWLAQAVLMLVYTMAGIGKLGGFFYQLCAGEMTVLNPHSFSEQIAARLLQTNANADVGGWLIDHYLIGWPFYLGMIYIQFFAFWAVFRPAMLRPWGMALVLFHIGSFFIFTILFTPNILLIGFFLLAAPAARPWNLGPAFWRELPLIGWGWRALFDKRGRRANLANLP